MLGILLGNFILFLKVESCVGRILKYKENYILFYVVKFIRCSFEKIYEKKMETKIFEIYKERKEKSMGG